MGNTIINFGIIGLGNIGAGVVKNFLKNQDLIRSRTGLQLCLKKVADIDPARKDALSLDSSLFTTDAYQIINDPDIPVVVELVGGTGVARDFVLKAIENDKMVVTANKALIAEYGRDILAVLEKHPKADMFFEASVGGGIPIIKVLREGFIGNTIESITGIINGTANYILTEMEQNHVSFEEALKSAQEKGYAEPDPTFDIEGFDSAHKIAILGSIAFGTWVAYKKMIIEGISHVTIQDVTYAARLGYRIKLLAMAARNGDGLEVRVCPTLLDRQHPLANVSGSFNAIYIYGNPIGECMLYGRGAGGDPTSSAVISDIVDAAESLHFDDPGNREIFNNFSNDLPVNKNLLSKSRYYIRIQAEDKPGVLSSVSGIFGKHDISISSLIQPEEKAGDSVPVIMMTHLVEEGNMISASKEIKKLSCIKGDIVIIRVLKTDN